MTYLSLLPADIQDLLVRLPFRVGLYISESDQTGGDESAEAERKALENIVTFYVEDTVKSEFAHEVMLVTLNNKEKWCDWATNIDQVPDECLQITYLLKDLIEPKEILAYKQNLIEVAIAIAQAYCELDKNTPAFTKIGAYFTVFLRKIQAILGSEEDQLNDYLLNISPLERAAIKRLSNNLDVQVRF
jgi:hypothetical protein